MIDSVPLIQNANDAQQINASIIAMKKASRELDEKIVKLNSLNSELDKKIALLDSGLSKEIEDRKEAINSLDVSSVGGSGKYISAISETDGKISATVSDITSSVSSGNSQPVTSGGVASELEKYPTFISTTMTDANQCVLNNSTLNRVYFYAGNFTTNVPRNTWAIVRCYQYGGGIVQFIDYTLATITETYRRYIRYDGQTPSAWEKIIRNSDLGNYLPNIPRANLTDCNTAETGLLCSNNVANTPNNTQGYVYVLTLSFNGDLNWRVQVCFPILNTTFYIRYKSNGTWGAWRSI